MTTRDLVKELEKRGHQVKYRERSDGAILITQIDGISYLTKSNAAIGNRVAREMLGVSLSARRESQLKTIKPPKEISPKRRKKQETLSDEVIKELRKTQKYWRETKRTQESRVTKKGLRYILEHKGIEEVRRTLKRAQMYARYYAYPEAVKSFAMRIDKWAIDSNLYKDWTRISKYLIDNQDRINDYDLQDAMDLMYEMEQLDSLHQDYDEENYVVRIEELVKVKKKIRKER